jgi:hypothetical protein
MASSVPRYQKGRRSAHERGDQDVSHGIGNDGADDARIEDHHGAGDGRHAAGHQGEELAAGQSLEIGADEERRLRHADEHVGCRGETQGAADAQGLAQYPGESLHHQGQHAPVEEQRRQGADDQEQGQGAEGEDEGVLGMADRKRGLAASQVAEDEPGPGFGGLLESDHHVVQPDE